MKKDYNLINKLDEYTLDGKPMFVRKNDDGFLVNAGNRVEEYGYSETFKVRMDDEVFFFKQERPPYCYISVITGEIASALGMKVVAPVRASMYYKKSNVGSEKICKGDDLVKRRSDGIMMYSYSDNADGSERICAYPLKNIREYSKDKISDFPSIYECMSAIVEMKKMEEFKDVKFDDEIAYDLIKIAIFDFLTFQPDRNPRNIEFLLRESPADSGNFTFECAPMFDTSLAFCPNTCQSNGVFHEAYTDLVKQYDELPRIFNGILNLENVYKYFERASNKTRTLTDIVKDMRDDAFVALGNISKVIVCNPKVRAFYNDIMDLDIKKLINETSKKHNISAYIMRDFLYIRDAFDGQRKLLDAAVRVEEIKRAEIIQNNRQKSMVNSSQTSK